jgi:hypothetical protein
MIDKRLSTVVTFNNDIGGIFGFKKYKFVSNDIDMHFARLFDPNHFRYFVLTRELMEIRPVVSYDMYNSYGIGELIIKLCPVFGSAEFLNMIIIKTLRGSEYCLSIKKIKKNKDNLIRLEYYTNKFVLHFFMPKDSYYDHIFKLSFNDFKINNQYLYKHNLGVIIKIKLGLGYEECLKPQSAKYIYSPNIKQIKEDSIDITLYPASYDLFDL